MSSGFDSQFLLVELVVFTVELPVFIVFTEPVKGPVPD